MINNSTIYIVSLVLVLCSCASVPMFPAKYIWELDFKAQNTECYRYEIISENPIKVSEGVRLDIEDCPVSSVMGFESEKDVGAVFSYIRHLQELAEKNCRY